MSSEKQESANNTNRDAQAAEASKSGRDLKLENANNNVKDQHDGSEQDRSKEEIKGEEKNSLGDQQGNTSVEHINNQESDHQINDPEKGQLPGGHQEEHEHQEHRDLEQVKGEDNRNIERTNNGRDFQHQQGSSSSSQFDVKYSTINHYYSTVKERKQAELDSQSLANRISLLKQEEVRTLKKIEETRKKAMEIYYLKLKNQKKASTKQAIIQAELTKKREKVAGQRALSQECRQTNKEMYETMKLENVKKLKEMKLNNERKIQIKKQQQIYEAHKRNENVKMQRENRANKMEEFKNWKRDNIKKETEEKALYEERVKQQKVKEMKRMEMLEMDIIQRLQSTQMMQKNAYEELESALLLNTQDFYDKYLKKEQAEAAQQQENQAKEQQQRTQAQEQKNAQGQAGNDNSTGAQNKQENNGLNNNTDTDQNINSNKPQDENPENQPSNKLIENKQSA